MASFRSRRGPLAVPTLPVLVLPIVLLLLGPAHSQASEPLSSAQTIKRAPALANSCVAFASRVGDGLVAVAGDGYAATAEQPEDDATFYLKPTGLGKYLLQDAAGRLLAAGAGSAVTSSDEAGPEAEWRIRKLGRKNFTLTSTTDGLRLGVDLATRELIRTAAGTGPEVSFRALAARDCDPFPEAEVNARGKSRRTTYGDGSVYGYADTHMHITANLRAGGEVIYGEPFHRFGIAEALGNDEDTHGPDGGLDVTGNLLRDGNPVGTHDTEGWPSFSGWPVNDTITHQQAYYRWVERAWRAGLRVLVTQAVEDTELCNIQPLRSHSCDEEETVLLAVRQLRALESYVDAQAGGPGRGWFRVVGNSREARRAVEAGKLAVIPGMETSSALGCSQFQGTPECSATDIDRELARLRRAGVRSIFVTHWIDNAFGGVALQDGAQGTFIGTFQAQGTGEPFETEPCGEADEADGTCNAKGFTDLGRYMVRRMMDAGMLIEVDHLSQKSRETVLQMAERNDYPLISSHTGTGGEWIPSQLKRLYASGGLASAKIAEAPRLLDKIRDLRKNSKIRQRGIPLGTDTGGFASFPGPRDDGPELEYPFRSYDGKVRFQRQRSGERTYDLNSDGVAHYGLIPDLIADMQRQPKSRAPMRALFRSAEAYLRMWERAEGRR